MKKLLTALILSAMITGCATTFNPAPVGKKLVWSTHDDRPGWTAQTTEADRDYRYFVGLSERHSTERGARDAALLSARTTAASFLGTAVKDEVSRSTEGKNAADATTNPDVALKRLEQTLAAHMIQRLEPETWYLENWLDDEGKPFWIAFVRSRVPVKLTDVETLAQDALAASGAGAVAGTGAGGDAIKVLINEDLGG